MMLKHAKYTSLVFCILSLVGMGALYQYAMQLSREKELLLQELNEYKRKEGETYVVERISKQMEDIAYQQKEISDKQREEAEFQMRKAEDMRKIAEEEQRKAETFAENAEEERVQAEKQRLLANQLRIQAEHAKTVADTLSYVALGRSLATYSSTLYQRGNYDIAALLAYASWKFTSDYKGDVYFSSIFNALSLNCGTYETNNLHNSGVTRIMQSNNFPDTFVSVSKYGEIIWWKRDLEGIKLLERFSDPSLSFRDACIDSKGTVYALSYNGIIQRMDRNGNTRTFFLTEEPGMKRISDMGDGRLLIASQRRLYIYNTTKKQTVRTVALPETFSTWGSKNNHWLIFGEKGGVWKMDDSGNLTEEETLPIKDKITAYTYSPAQQWMALGTDKGEIHLMDEYGNTLRKLKAHESTITQLSFRNNRLISSGYDCCINMWDLEQYRIDKIPLKTLSSWVYCFTLTSHDYIITGEEQGIVSWFSISPENMAKRIQKNLKRDFTEEEWSYYIGSHIPQIRMKHEE